MSNSARKRRSRRWLQRYGHKRARQGSNATLRGDYVKIARGTGYSSTLPQPTIIEFNGVKVRRVQIEPDQNRQAVAGNRCGNECGRRALMGDYLCSRCRQ